MFSTGSLKSVLLVSLSTAAPLAIAVSARPEVAAWKVQAEVGAVSGWEPGNRMKFRWERANRSVSP